MQVDDSGRVRGFSEKPQTEEELERVRMDPAWIDAHGIEADGRSCLASMGIYLFSRDMPDRSLAERRPSRLWQAGFPVAH